MFAKHSRREFANQATSEPVNSEFIVRQTCLTLRSVIKAGKLLGKACHKR